jgi:hypothetical protein
LLNKSYPPRSCVDPAAPRESLRLPARRSGNFAKSARGGGLAMLAILAMFNRHTDR